ncbi:MAG: hypothetical protein CM1200mP2_31790 [Planctomycetaceae bacterium]|nr:MAG: hypothetical protein CM1200mP2_31790 [Planctomycetaceae bacterium]
MVTGDESGEAVQDSLKRFLPRIGEATSWHSIGGGDFSNVAELIERIDTQQVDMLVTRRHLQEENLAPSTVSASISMNSPNGLPFPVLVFPGDGPHAVGVVDRTVPPGDGGGRSHQR